MMSVLRTARAREVRRQMPGGYCLCSVVPHKVFGGRTRTGQTPLFSPEDGQTLDMEPEPAQLEGAQPRTTSCDVCSVLRRKGAAAQASDVQEAWSAWMLRGLTRTISRSDRSAS